MADLTGDDGGADLEAGRAPRGREEVRAALMNAAVELVAARGPHAVSGRDVAARARVNYGLIHHYFGTKENVIREAMAAQVNRYAQTYVFDADEPRLPPPLFFAGDEPYWRAFVRIAYDYETYGALISAHPLAQGAADILARQSGRPVDADIKALVAASTAMQFGWLSLRAFLLAAVGADPDEICAIEERVKEIVASITELG